jgi:hypothetical protein
MQQTKSTTFEPIGGFPPIILENKEKIQDNSIKSRGFVTTKNIVSIGDILTKKGKESAFITFGSES